MEFDYGLTAGEIRTGKITRLPKAQGIALSSGASLTPIPVELRAVPEKIAAAKQEKGGVFVVGRIAYRDIFQQPHETAFCWKYSFEAEGFLLVDDPKLNYNT